VSTSSRRSRPARSAERRHGRRRLRIHRLTASSVYTLTWNVASPRGRGTFHLDKADDGEPVLVWRRIGDHDIYPDP
jgi:hypothetical protein